MNRNPNPTSKLIDFAFHCKVCNVTFGKMFQFINHKRRKHYVEFLNTKCIVFEERSMKENQNLAMVISKKNSSSASKKKSQGESNAIDDINKQMVKHEIPLKTEAENSTKPVPLQVLAPVPVSAITQIIPIPIATVLPQATPLTQSGSQNIADPPKENGNSLATGIAGAGGVQNQNPNTNANPNPNPNLLYVIIRRSTPVSTPSAAPVKTSTNESIGMLLNNLLTSTSTSVKAPLAPGIKPASVIAANKAPIKSTSRTMRKHSTDPCPSDIVTVTLSDSSDSETETEAAMDSDTIEEIQGYLDELRLERPFVCDICERRYLSQKDLNSHKLSHSNEKPFKCPQLNCDQAFKTTSSLNLHLRRHTDYKPFKCSHPNCAKTFKCRSDLKNHEHRHTSDEKFECPEPNCDKIFYSYNSVRFHVNSKHRVGEHPPELTCFVCQKTFYYKSTFENHFASHRLERPFKCEKEGCSSSFKLKTQLVQHQQFVHDGAQKNQECKYCGKTYSKMATLKKHIHLVHKK